MAGEVFKGDMPNTWEAPVSPVWTLCSKARQARQCKSPQKSMAKPRSEAGTSDLSGCPRDVSPKWLVPDSSSTPMAARARSNRWERAGVCPRGKRELLIAAGDAVPQDVSQPEPRGNLERLGRHIPSDQRCQLRSNHRIDGILEFGHELPPVYIAGDSRLRLAKDI
jgi:hypothetical protein